MRHSSRVWPEGKSGLVGARETMSTLAQEGQTEGEEGGRLLVREGEEGEEGGGERGGEGRGGNRWSGERYKRAFWSGGWWRWVVVGILW